MQYQFACDNHEDRSYFTVSSPITEGPPKQPSCPLCDSNLDVIRVYFVPPIHYNASGFSGDYHKRNPGRGRSWDKLEQLNTEWSKHYGEPPPPADTKGTYDGT